MLNQHINYIHQPGFGVTKWALIAAKLPLSLLWKPMINRHGQTNINVSYARNPKASLFLKSHNPRELLGISDHKSHETKYLVIKYHWWSVISPP